MKALNDLRETLSDKYNRGGSVTEACLRVTSGQKGGAWVFGRVVGDRHMYLIIEKCPTLNDMYDVVTQTIEGILSNVIL